MVTPAEVRAAAPRGETQRHLSLKRLALAWAAREGLGIAAPEVSFPHRRFRVDVAACELARKTPSRKPLLALTKVLKTAVIFECKQGRGDLVRDNKRRMEVGDRLRTLEARRRKLESLLQLHLPHLSNCDSLFPEFDSYRLREHRHAGYEKLLREIRMHKQAVIDGTKFDRLLDYQMANLHYIVAEEGLMEAHEVPDAWGLLIRRGDALELVTKPAWQPLGVEEQLIFLQRIAARKVIDP